MLTFDEVTRSMQVDPTSKTPYSDATQVSYNRCGEHPSRQSNSGKIQSHLQLVIYLHKKCKCRGDCNQIYHMTLKYCSLAHNKRIKLDILKINIIKKRGGGMLVGDKHRSRKIFVITLQFSFKLNIMPRLVHFQNETHMLRWIIFAQ